MKRIFNSIIAIVAVLGTVSCAKELVESTPQENTQNTIKVTASIEKTKVVYTDNGTAIEAAWEVGDQVFGASEAGTCTFEVTAINANVADMSLVSGTAPAEGNTVVLAYAPALSVANIKSNALALSFTEQNSNLANIKNRTYMSAQGTVASGTLNLKFKQEVALLEITGFSGIPLDSDPVKIIVDGTNINGSAKLASTDGVWGLVPIKDGGITVTTVGAGNNYIAVPPTTEATTLQFGLIKNGRTYVATKSGSKQLVAGKCYSVGSLAFTEISGDEHDLNMMAKGYDLNNYNKVILPSTWNKFWNSTGSGPIKSNSSDATTPDGTFYWSTGGSDSNGNKYAATNLLSYSDIPVGSVISINRGYTVRPEAWKLNSSNQTSGCSTTGATRPAEVTSSITPVDLAWWGSWVVRAFNIRSEWYGITDPAAISKIQNALAIYVPKTIDVDTSEQDAKMTAAGYDLSAYNKVIPELETFSFWWSTSLSYKYSYKNMRNDANIIQFASTNLINKANLPNGTVIVMKDGYAYRPDGFVTVGEKLSSGRPNEVKTALVVVDDSWWGSFTVRGFNVFKVNGSGKSNLTTDQQAQLYGTMVFYVPKS